MKLPAMLLLLAVTVPALADNSRPFETTQEARQRHEADRYDQYRQRGNSEPLGGYSEPLGDPYQGRVNNGPVYQPAPNSTWQDRAKR